YDHDGVGDFEDWCGAYSSAGQETHAPGTYGYGCGPNYPSMRHVESWPVGPPLHYAISANGDPNNGDGSDFTEIQAGFHAWEQVDGASLTIGVDSPVAQQISSSNDGINLVTFEDSRVPLPPNVFAVTPTFSLTHQAAFMDRIYLPGQIIDP